MVIHEGRGTGHGGDASAADPEISDPSRLFSPAADARAVSSPDGLGICRPGPGGFNLPVTEFGLSPARTLSWPQAALRLTVTVTEPGGLPAVTVRRAIDGS